MKIFLTNLHYIGGFIIGMSISDKRTIFGTPQLDLIVLLPIGIVLVILGAYYKFKVYKQ